MISIQHKRKQFGFKFKEIIYSQINPNGGTNFKSLNHFCKVAKVSPSSVVMYINGERKGPGLKGTLRRVSVALGLADNYFTKLWFCIVGND